MIGIMYVFKIGPSILFKANYGPFLFEKLMMPLSILIPVGAIALSLLVGYGLLEFVGAYRFVDLIFKTPGKSAVDAVASFVGRYSLGLLITNRVYKQGMYNKTRSHDYCDWLFNSFSATFMIIVAKTFAGLMPHWNLYFWITLVITFVVTAVLHGYRQSPMNQQNIITDKKENKKLLLKERAENCICRGDETKCINTIPGEERLGQFERRFRNDCWYFAFYIIDWFFRTDCSELYTIH